MDGFASLFGLKLSGESLVCQKSNWLAVNHTIFYHLCKKDTTMETSPRIHIDAFLGQKHIALAGYSHTPKKFGHVVYKILKEKGYTVHPVNPAGGKAPGGERVHAGLETLPLEVEALLIMTKPEITPVVVEQALEKGIKYLWVQQLSGSKDVKQMLDDNQVEAVYNRCILLHANPSGIHKFHRWILGVLGRLPSM